ncbi:MULTISPECIES: RES family NAD+ phosphorylase [unclassified Rhodococcus (in: high G+C Gram-positive bacteria)]|uniref:RES family NAD+ phosphorylase n=1 Tax=unclassified Rhodococcus (in: high G+C Gram-positive bacteria) TaxID=192944 RepID=UPI001FFAF9DD|nr:MULTISPECIES: RES family NAD+ phosphorylase [unclassified Rhodococcus (in: high G+C Gram-positive bacteria)]
MSAPRTALHLLAPPPPDHLRDRFPVFRTPAGAEVFRCHSATRGPLWFANGGHGRFDLANMHGTCYTAESEQITLLETWGGMRVVPSTELSARALTRMRITEPRELADLTSNAAAQFGVTAEVFTTGNYQLTQLWASALRSAGFTGIRYWARHDLAHTHACLALFDTAGTHTSANKDPHSYAISTTATLSERPDLIDALQHDTGITVLPIPQSL